MRLVMFSIFKGEIIDIGIIRNDHSEVNVCDYAYYVYHKNV